MTRNGENNPFSKPVFSGKKKFLSIIMADTNFEHKS
jgi:hypothetical protein